MPQTSTQWCIAFSMSRTTIPTWRIGPNSRLIGSSLGARRNHARSSVTCRARSRMRRWTINAKGVPAPLGAETPRVTFGDQLADQLALSDDPALGHRAAVALVPNDLLADEAVAVPLDDDLLLRHPVRGRPGDDLLRPHILGLSNGRTGNQRDDASSRE